MADHIVALLIGFALDLLVGDPEWFPHPVRGMGLVIRKLEGALRARGGNLRRAAPLLCLGTLGISMAAAALALWLCSLGGRRALLAGMSLISWMCLSARNLSDEANGVRRALPLGIEAGRARVARIVGRDTAALSQEEVIVAAVETVAENTVDGVISPMIYLALGGPVLGMGFKAASTLDSMVGYLDEKYRDIGWFSAKLDDWLNWIPARLTAVLMCAAARFAGLDGDGARRIVRRDHANHLSPNCAWPESAAAGAIGIRLGGAHRYFGKLVVKPTIGDDLRPPEVSDIGKANRLLYGSAVLALALLALTAWALRRILSI